MSKIAEAGRTVETEKEEKERRRKDKVILSTGGGEATNPENMEDLHESVRSRGME